MKKPNQRRLRFIAEYLANPNARQAAVKAGYPWGKGELAGAADPRRWQAEMWGALRAWLRTGAIADDAELKADLTGPEYGYNVRDEIQLEAKDDMKARGLASPDTGDALAPTFAWPLSAGSGAGAVAAPSTDVVMNDVMSRIIGGGVWYTATRPPPDPEDDDRPSDDADSDRDREIWRDEED